MSGIPLSYWTGLGAMPAGRADPVACARLLEVVRLKGLWANQPGERAIAEVATLERERKALADAGACRDALATAAPRVADGPGRIQVAPPAPAAAPAGFVMLPSHMYRTYPQLQGARIRNGYKLYKGPGEFFYIKDSAGRTVAQGLRATSSGPLFRGASGRVSSSRLQAPVSNVPTARPTYTYTVPQRGAFVGFDSKLQPLDQLFRRPAQEPLSIRTIPTWVWVVGGTLTLLLVGGAAMKRRG